MTMQILLSDDVLANQWQLHLCKKVPTLIYVTCYGAIFLQFLVSSLFSHQKSTRTADVLFVQKLFEVLG